MSDLPCLFGVLALETAAPPARLALEREAAQALAQHVADDLQRLLPGVAALDLALAALHFDPAELLQPGWPRHAALATLLARAPGAGAPRVIAFAAHAGQPPLPALAPAPEAQGGALRLLPFLLQGAPAALAALAPAFEEHLVERGMAGAATALHCQDAFGVRLEHARYLSLHDLCALTALQYEHAGLAPLWPLLEAALFRDSGERWLDAPPEPVLRYAAQAVRLALPADATPAARLRLAQYAAVLEAHGIAHRRVAVDAGQDARAALRD